MADEYGDLLDEVATVIVAGSLVDAPSGTNPIFIPSWGASTWMSLHLRSTGSAGADGSDVTMEEHELIVSAIVPTTFDERVGQRATANLGLTVRKLLTANVALGPVSAHAFFTGQDIENPGNGSFILTMNFLVRQAISLA